MTIATEADMSTLGRALNILYWIMMLVSLVSPVCPPGRHGERCAQACSGGCLISCHPSTGACIGGCRAGSYGETHCSQSCDGCASPYTCQRITGRCDGGCRLGRYGQRCDQTCSANCKAAYSCEPTRGACFGGCKAGKYGIRCTQSCGGCAPLYTCHIISGVCDGGCLSGRYGGTCENTCSANCKTPYHCNQVNGTCIGGCQDWFILNCMSQIRAVKLSDESAPSVVDVTEYSVKIVWYQDPDVARGTEAHVGYLIRYAESGYQMNDAAHYTDTDAVVHKAAAMERQTLVFGLLSDTEYHFRVLPFRVWPSTAPGPMRERNFSGVSNLVQFRTSGSRAQTTRSQTPKATLMVGDWSLSDSTLPWILFGIAITLVGLLVIFTVTVRKRRGQRAPRGDINGMLAAQIPVTYINSVSGSLSIAGSQHFAARHSTDRDPCEEVDMLSTVANPLSANGVGTREDLVSYEHLSISLAHIENVQREGYTTLQP